jgi:hypothetical protein
MAPCGHDPTLDAETSKAAVILVSARSADYLFGAGRVLPHIDHIFDAVVNVPLAGFQCGRVHLANDCLKEAQLTLINHEVSRGPLLAPEYLALQHRLSIP